MRRSMAAPISTRSRTSPSRVRICSGTQPVESALEREELTPRLSVVERRILEGDADPHANRLGILGDVVALPPTPSPAWACSSVHRIRTTVDLPAPLGPRNP